MENYRIQLEPGRYYHIFNHAVGQENLFLEDKNYAFFLEKFEKYIVEFVDVYVYCLMPNHFHFLIRVKETCQTTLKVSDRLGFNIVSNAFKKFFTSYTNSFNKVYYKKGSLFQPRFKRRLIEDENHLRNTILYIHNNPVSHGFVSNMAEWKFSSYNTILEKNTPDWLKSSEVIGLFDDVSNFIFCHSKNSILSDTLNVSDSYE
ncbi:MAG TPA: hypothetical protein VLH61_09505 [Bacteroidales bacterium]|nr:hypothetical protein [Bacteroidales bacterium]